MRKAPDFLVKQKNQAGSTMVEVIVSFAMLTMITAMFANVFLICSRMTSQASRLLEENARFYEDYYLREGIRTEWVCGGTVVFQRVDQDFFSVEEMELYQHTSTEGWRGAIYDVMGNE